MPGTRIPGFLAIGTFLGSGKKEFWAAIFYKNSIEIELENEKFTKIVLNSNHIEFISLWKSFAE